MKASTLVNNVKSLLGSVTNGDFTAVSTAYAAAPVRRRLAAAGSLKALAEASYSSCAHWSDYNTFYTAANDGFTNFVDGFITAAIDGTGAFAGLTVDAGRVEAIEKGVADILATQMALCSIQGTAGNTAANWDLAYSYYHGDTPARAPFGRANKRCKNYGTCLNDGETATANKNMLAALAAGKAAATGGDTATVAAQYTIFESNLMIVYYQAALRYAHLLDEDVTNSVNTRGNDHQGEGWAFWRVIEPLIANKGGVAATGATFTTAFYNTANEITGTDHYCPLKWLLENNLPTGMTAADMGTLTARASSSQAACTGTQPSFGVEASSGLGAGILVIIIVGGLLGAAVAAFLVKSILCKAKVAGDTKGSRA
jgi:hypothetical protein